MELFERAPELTAVGAGLLIQPTGQLVMHRLGLLTELMESAHPVGTLRSRTRRGKVFCELSYGEIGGGVTGLGVHRATLLATLVGAMRREEVPLLLGVTVEHLQRDGDRHWVLDSGGGRHGLGSQQGSDFLTTPARAERVTPGNARPGIQNIPWRTNFLVGRLIRAMLRMNGTGKIVRSR